MAASGSVTICAAQTLPAISEKAGDSALRRVRNLALAEAELERAIRQREPDACATGFGPHFFSQRQLHAMKAPQMATAAFQDFLTTPLQARLPRHLTTSPQDRVVELFRGAARDVPAYREFLTSQGIDSADVKTYADFQTLPLGPLREKLPAGTQQNQSVARQFPAK